MTRTMYRLDRRAVLRIAAGLAVAGPLLVPVGRPPRAQTPATGALDKVSFMTDWRAQAEHGGYYQAIAAGLYRKAGIECELRQGGPSLNSSQLLLAGRVDMVMSSSFEAFAYVREDAPFFTIAAIFQKDPQVLIGHPDTGFDSFEALKGRTILIGSGGRVTYWPYLRQKYGLSDSQVRPYNFSMAPFLADKNVVQQGFLTSEPYSIAQALGRPPSVLLIADAGFSAYQATIAISRKMAAEKKELVQRFVDATLEGWAQYLKGGPGHRGGQRADQAGQPGADRRPHRLRHQGLERARHRAVGRRAEGRHRRHERPTLEELSTTRWPRSTWCPRGSTSAAPIRWNS